MNASQRGMYHGEKSKWQAARRAFGRPCDDAALRALHASVGAPHSSTAFSQDDLTRVIGAFKAVSAMDDFNAQMHAQGTYKERALVEIETLAKETGIKGGLKGVSGYFKKWLVGIPVERQGDETLRKLVGIMHRRKAQLAKPQPAPAPTPAVEVPADPDFDEANPFG
jgi:hypothetical protein